MVNNNVGDLGAENADRLLNCVLSLPPNSTLVDLGVRLGQSSRIMLTQAAERKNHVHGVEAIGCAPSLEDILALPYYHFHSGDSVTTGLELKPSNLSLVMFDTFHFAEHILCELYAWWPHIQNGGWCVFHDTNWTASHHDVYAGRVLPQAIEGVREFFDGFQCDTYPDSWGMTFAQKKENMPDLVARIPESRWREIFEVRRAVMNAVNLPIKWKDIYQ